MAMKTGFASYTEIVPLIGYISSFKRLSNFVAEMCIILKVDSWPNAKACQNYIWGQLLMLSFFGISSKELE